MHNLGQVSSVGGSAYFLLVLAAARTFTVAETLSLWLFLHYSSVRKVESSEMLCCCSIAILCTIRKMTTARGLAGFICNGQGHYTHVIHGHGHWNGPLSRSLSDVPR